MSRTFSSVREALNGVMSGAVIPSTRRRVSCPTNETLSTWYGDSGLETSRQVSGLTHGGFGESSPPREQTKAMKDTSDGGGIAPDSKEEDSFEYNVFVRHADDEANNKEFDISAITDDDLRRLKRDDPFLYYSIPAVRRRSYRFHEENENDDDDENAIWSLRSSHSRRSSLPAEVLAEAENTRSRRGQGEPVEDATKRDSVVRRNRRFSTEAHPSLVCGELLQELKEMNDSDMDEDLEILEMDLDDM
mmetsp:Transcript_3980/g.8941  ORF Transcript_3980/g.8941 Transcript_3980/m.8941 type:complete len:247 (+) Transcript_3980:243-983(+)